MDQKFDLQNHIEQGVEKIVADTLKATLKNPKESAFMVKFAAASRKASKTRQKYEKEGIHVPGFLIASITSACNLHCAGCYSRCSNATNDAAPVSQLTDEEWFKIFREADDLGIKSTRITDPDSEEMKAFILDCDVVKEMIPEFQKSHGAAADAVHFESFNIMDSAMQQFLTGDLKGTNVIIPIVAGDFDELMQNYIKPFEDAGYHVTAKFAECEENASVSRNLARELETGRIINSAVVMSFGEKPLQVYEKLAPMQNAFGETYGQTELSSGTAKEVKPAA